MKSVIGGGGGGGSTHTKQLRVLFKISAHILFIWEFPPSPGCTAGFEIQIRVISFSEKDKS